MCAFRRQNVLITVQKPSGIDLFPRRVRSRLPPPARSPLRNLRPTISAQPAEVADPPPKTLSPLQQCAHVRDRVGIAFQAVRILFGLQFNLQPDAVRIVEVEGLAIPPFDNFGTATPWSLSPGTTDEISSTDRRRGFFLRACECLLRRSSVSRDRHLGRVVQNGSAVERA